MKKNHFLLLIAGCFCLLQLSAQNTSPYWSLAGNSNAAAGSKLGTTNAIPLRLHTVNVERMRIGTDGRVSIGITSGIGKLTLQGNGSVPAAGWIAAGTPVLASFGESGVGNGDYIMAMAANGYNARSVLLLRKSRGTLASPTVVNANDFLGSLLASGYDGSKFQNPASVDFFADEAPTPTHVPTRISFSTGTNSATRAERMTIKPNGNVGIGTTLPSQKLHVVGNQLLEGNLNFNTGQQFIQFANPVSGGPAMMYMLASGTTNQPRMVLSHSPAYSNYGLQYVDNGDYFNFLGAGISRMVVNLGTGNVGIGTTNPSYRLSVNGTIQAKEVRVETGWADYVFEKGYRLRPLAEVQQYIAQHGHLPDMASAKEIQEKGLAVAETQTKMMAKIEELTLYVISLQQQIDELKKETKATNKLSKN